MFFIFINSIVIYLANFIDSYKFSRPSYFFVLSLLTVSLMILPSIQYGVGTDYFNYIRIFNSPNELELYAKKNEWFFYFSVLFFNYLDLPNQAIFVFFSFFTSALMVNVFRKYKNVGFSLFLLVFCFLFVTNMVHNQLNVIRTYLAVYAVLNALVYRVERRYVLSLFFSLFAVICHQTAYLFIPFIFLPLSIYFYVLRHFFVFYVVMFLVFAFGVPFLFVELIVSKVAPFYLHYLDGGGQASSPIAIATRVIYLPFHLYFLWLMYSRKIFFRTELEKVSVSIWILSANFHFLFLYWEHFFRPYHYMVFFTILPIYYVFINFRRSPFFLGVAVLFVILPYLAKVLFFPSGEYAYCDIALCAYFNH